jgi:hypothetical protein
MVVPCFYGVFDFLAAESFLASQKLASSFSDRHLGCFCVVCVIAVSVIQPPPP